MTKDQARAFGLLRVAYPRWGSGFDTPQLIEDWASLFEDIPGELLVAKVRKLAMACQWPPTPAQIREACGYGEMDGAERARVYTTMDDALDGALGDEVRELAGKHIGDPVGFRAALREMRRGS